MPAVFVDRLLTMLATHPRKESRAVEGSGFARFLAGCKSALQCFQLEVMFFQQSQACPDNITGGPVTAGLHLGI